MDDGWTAGTEVSRVTDAPPRVGVGVLVIREGRVLLGERRGSHGAGTWAPPGGHLEYGESPGDCARRELGEETGLEARVIGPGPYTSDLFEPEGLHYVTLFVLATEVSGEPEVREPAKCARWEWFRWSALPSPLFPPVQSLRKQGYIPPGTA
ncbi:MAG TPA: NUDIX hydrolase [Gemmatimonadales bacterium]